MVLALEYVVVLVRSSRSHTVETKHETIDLFHVAGNAHKKHISAFVAPRCLVLKVARLVDLEPCVFRELSDSTSKVLYDCFGMDGPKQYHCWCMERSLHSSGLVR